MCDVFKKWYLELLESKKGTVIGEKIIYNGFIILKKEEEYRLLRHTNEGDGYTDIKENHLNILLDKGFIKGSDSIVYKRNLKRFNYHKKAIEELTKIKEKFDVTIHIQGVYADQNKKELRNVMKNHVEAYYQMLVRISRFKNRYKNN